MRFRQRVGGWGASSECRPMGKAMLDFLFNLGVSDRNNGSGNFGASSYGANLTAEERAAYNSGYRA